MKILIVNGPNLNMLGLREVQHYGTTTLSDIQERVSVRATNLGVEVDFFQSNYEGAIVDYLQNNYADASGIIINAGALTHYSVAIHDALKDTGLPIVEIHLSNIHGREEFRHRSVIAPIAEGQITGLGWQGYIFGLEFLVSNCQISVK